MLLAQVQRIEQSAVGGQRIDGRINALFRDLAFQIDEGVEVLEGVGRGGVGRIVGRHVHGLDAGDGPLGRARDPLLQFAHFRGQGRLITHGTRHTAEQGRHFRTGLREAEDVVHEQQRVGPGRIAEPLAHGQGRQGDAETGAGRFVHLAEHHGGLRDDRPAGGADLRLLHFEPEVVAFARPFADAGKHGVAAVLAGDAGDQFGENDRLAQPGPAEQPRLAAAHQRSQEIDDLDARLEQFGLGRQLARTRGGSA